MSEGGRASLTFAGDHVYWTDTIAAAAQNYATQVSGQQINAGEVWLLGSASDRVRKEMTNIGFSLHEDVVSMLVAPST